MNYTAPESLESFPRADAIRDQDSSTLATLLKNHKISDAEYETLREIMGRAPTFSELGVFSSMWSEHCSYKSSRVHLGRFPTEGESVVVGPGENAGVVRLHNKLCIAFKMESHNHPSYIEPYQGAATGVGGILRDVFCMGARPIANLNCLRFGKRTHERTPYLFENIVRGIGDYGNCIGVPTVGGNTSFDATYDGNCLVNAMTVGVIHEDRIFKGFATGKGNLLVYVGSATGRDGIHGATMASDSFDSAEDGERSAVQVGDPFTEKLLLEATLECLEKNLVIGLQDMGAAGLTSSSFEMAGRAGNGLYIDLDRVPVRTDGMSAYELLLSESQERMLMVVEPDKWQELERTLERWELAYDIIGAVTDTGRIQATYQGVCELDVPVAPLTDRAPKYDRPRQPLPPINPDKSFDDNVSSAIGQKTIAELLEQTLADAGASHRIFEQYDQDIGTKTVLNSRHGGAAVLWLRSEWTKDKPHLGVAIATACNQHACAINAREGGALAVLKPARMIAAAGGQPLAVTDCLNFGNPEQPAIMQQFSDGVDGISDACRALGVAVVSGNVSLYNETDGTSIAPTPMIGMVGRVEDVRSARPAIIEQDSVLAILFPKAYQTQFGGSQVGRLLEQASTGACLPPILWDAEREAIAYLSQDHEGLLACRDVGAGGLATTLSKMCMGGRPVGFTLSESRWGIAGYFSEVGPTYILSFASQQAFERAGSSEFENMLLKAIGSTSVDTDAFTFGNQTIEREKMSDAYHRSMKL